MDMSAFSGRFHRASLPAPGILLLEFARPPVNAFSDEMWTELRTIVDRVSETPEIRVLVLSSAVDKAFTAGLDLNAQDKLNNVNFADPARRAFALRDHLLDFQDAISALERCRQPVIVTLFGISLGLALDIASACDVRIASSDVKLGIVEVNVGLAADIGTLQRFPKVVGNDSLARELAMTGRMFDAREALQMGFVSRVVEGGRQEVVAAALEMAKVIASKSPVAVAGTKHLMNYSRDHAVVDGLDYTASWNMAMLQAEDTPVAMKATLEKRTPVYKSLGRQAKL